MKEPIHQLIHQLSPQLTLQLILQLTIQLILQLTLQLIHQLIRASTFGSIPVGAQLHYLRARHVARISQRHRDGQHLGGGRYDLRSGDRDGRGGERGIYHGRGGCGETERGVLELRVGKAVAKGEAHGRATRGEVAVSDVQALPVGGLARVGRKVGLRGAVLEV